MKNAVPSTMQIAPPAPAMPCVVMNPSATRSPTPASTSRTAPTFTGMTRIARNARSRQSAPTAPGTIMPGW